MFKLTIESIIRPTEDFEKVKIAFRNVLPKSNPEIRTLDSAMIIRAESQSLSELSRLHDLLRKERILDAARRSFFAGLGEHGIEFSLNKQAAFVGRISFCGLTEESPLGAIHFSIQCSDPTMLIEWLAPKTLHGKPLQELPMPSFNMQT